MILTVFTPVYNRAYILGKLYESLLVQTCKEFEWIIVDDGSTDDVARLVEKWINEEKIDIRFFRQENGGKHRAINRGVAESSGELFFIVDSDDHLTPDAVEWILRDYQEIRLDRNIAGIGFMRCDSKGIKIGSQLPFDRKICDAFCLTYQYRATGDMAEVYKTEILKKYPFPETKDRFCPEALVWFRIADKYQILWINRCIYVCEYLTDGLTNKITKIHHLSPGNSMMFYSEHYHRKRIPISVRLKALINFWRFSFSSKIPFKDKVGMTGICGSMMLPIGFMFYLKDKR